MKPWATRAWTVAAGLAVGAVACLAIGAAPGAGKAPAAAHVDWRLPAKERPELAKADAVWKERAPWGAAPDSAAEPPPPPAYVPAGVLAAGRSWRAVFVAAGQPEVEVKAGDALPDGGKVTAVTRSRVSWTDREGNKREHELLSDPLPSQNPNP